MTVKQIKRMIDKTIVEFDNGLILHLNPHTNHVEWASDWVLVHDIDDPRLEKVNYGGATYNHVSLFFNVERSGAPSESGPIAFRSNKEWIENLQVGDMALDCFGNISKVVEISYRGKDINGREYVGYYTAHGVGTGSKISHSAKEGEIIPTIPLTSKYNRIDNVPEEIVTGTIYGPTEGEWVEQLWNEENNRSCSLNPDRCQFEENGRCFLPKSGNGPCKNKRERS